MTVHPTLSPAPRPPVKGMRFTYGRTIPTDPVLRARRAIAALARAANSRGVVHCARCRRDIESGVIVVVAGQGRRFRCQCESCAAALLPFESVVERYAVTSAKTVTPATTIQ